MNEQIIKVLEVLASKLGTTSEYLWEILVKQAYINSIIYIILFIGCCSCYYLALKYLQRFDFHNLSDGEEFISIIVLSLIFVVLVSWGIISIASISDIITGFLNPEYWALKTILSQLK